YYFPKRHTIKFSWGRHANPQFEEDLRSVVTGRRFKKKGLTDLGIRFEIAEQRGSNAFAHFAGQAEHIKGSYLIPHKYPISLADGVPHLLHPIEHLKPELFDMDTVFAFLELPDVSSAQLKCRIIRLDVSEEPLGRPVLIICRIGRNKK